MSSEQRFWAIIGTLIAAVSAIIAYLQFSAPTTNSSQASSTKQSPSSPARDVPAAGKIGILPYALSSTGVYVSVTNGSSESASISNASLTNCHRYTGRKPDGFSIPLKIINRRDSLISPSTSEKIIFPFQYQSDFLEWDLNDSQTTCDISVIFSTETGSRVVQNMLKPYDVMDNPQNALQP